MSASDTTMGNGQVFTKQSPAQLVRRMAGIVGEAWPDLGETKEVEPGQIQFAGREGIKVIVGRDEGGEVYVECALTLRSGGLPAEALESVTELSAHWMLGWEEAAGQTPPALGLRRLVRDGIPSLLELAEWRRELDLIRQVAALVCPARSASTDEAALRKVFKGMQGIVKPVMPWAGGDDGVPVGVSNWAAETADLFESGLCIGITCECDIERRLAIVLVAGACLQKDIVLGQVLLPSLDAQKLVQLAQNTEGRLVMPARALGLTVSPYEMGNATTSLLAVLNSAGTPCLFEGTFSELQTLFHGGQGAKNDPLMPVLRRVPDIPVEALASFGMREAAEGAMLSPKTQAKANEDILNALTGHPGNTAKRLLPHLIKHAVAKSSRGCLPDVDLFASRLGLCHETFAGLGTQRSQDRSAEVQAHFLQGACDPQLGVYLRERVLGQERALDEFGALLKRETLTRPLGQPFTGALQGTPGTGKSETLSLLAKWLDVPYVVIDAASMPDPHTAASQLLGSGRGIVGSYQAGRLEQVAKHHRGAVVEVADLDHAVPSVRSALGDLFLQILETGEAQSAVGSMFSCSNLAILFTLNLPGGKDEKAYRRTGFGPAPVHADVSKDVQRAVKEMVSGAFLSRVGEPVLFEPLSLESRVRIVHRAIEDSARTALDRLGSPSARITVANGAADALLAGWESSAMSHGARGLVRLARTETAIAVEAWHGPAFSRKDGVPWIELAFDGRLRVSVSAAES